MVGASSLHVRGALFLRRALQRNAFLYPLVDSVLIATPVFGGE
jgi:hypothetical protein